MVIIMVMTVVTLSKVPYSLRGDLSKWMQEIATGVYVGNFNTRIREELWKRIKQGVRTGEATMTYANRNELGYQFETYRTQRKNISYDGVPLVMIPKNEEESRNQLEKGFSKAANFRKAKKFASKKQVHFPINYVVIDIETDGLNSKENHMIEIAAIKISNGEEEKFQKFLKYDYDLPKEITDLTGITKEMLIEGGEDIKKVLKGFVDFIGNFPLVGYNLNFDVEFINSYLDKYKMHSLTNKKIDILPLIKKENMFLSSYKLENVLPVYDVHENVNHRAMEDAYLIYKLSTKVNEFFKILKREG